ncbi:protein TolA, partial [Candidatus Parcubacteria bacterium]|nr:protein TolA [Candidatus Parcubacteria bacterium]
MPKNNLSQKESGMIKREEIVTMKKELELARGGVTEEPLIKPTFVPPPPPPPEIEKTPPKKPEIPKLKEQ